MIHADAEPPGVANGLGGVPHVAQRLPLTGLGDTIGTYVLARKINLY